jgi:hypothetical protein
MSAHAFAHSLNVAPAGICAELLRIRGGLEVFNGGAATGLFALARAASLLHDRDDLVRVLTVAVHEPRDVGDGAVGAVCVRVEREGPTRIVGVATAGPLDAASAMRRACEGTDPRRERGDTVIVVGDGADRVALADSVLIAARGPLAGLGACVAASPSGRTLVVATSAGALSCALLLEHHG